MRTIIIVAMTPDGLIGAGGQLPWHEAADLRHFKRTTMGQAVIMGRKTFDSIGRALPGRRNIVITRDPAGWQRARPDATRTPSNSTGAATETSIEAVGSLEAALERCRERNETKAFIIGGAQIFEPALRIADEMLVTEIDRPGLTGDTYFPEWDRRAWRQADVEDCEGLRVTRYERVT